MDPVAHGKGKELRKGRVQAGEARGRGGSIFLQENRSYLLRPDGG